MVSALAVRGECDAAPSWGRGRVRPGRRRRGRTRCGRSRRAVGEIGDAPVADEGDQLRLVGGLDLGAELFGFVRCRALPRHRSARGRRARLRNMERAFWVSRVESTWNPEMRRIWSRRGRSISRLQTWRIAGGSGRGTRHRRYGPQAPLEDEMIARDRLREASFIARAVSVCSVDHLILLKIARADLIPWQGIRGLI